MIISLTKIPYSKLTVISKAILYYIESIEHDKMNDLEKLIFSIAQDLFHKKIKNKINQQFPSQKYSLKMTFHEGYVLNNSFLAYQNTLLGTDLESAIIGNFKDELFKQII